MLFRAALFLVLVAATSARAQEFFNHSLSIRAEKTTPRKVDSAWLDLRQTPAAASKPQITPDWVEAISIVPAEKKPGEPEKTVFRIRVTQPSPEAQVLFFRLFFDDHPDRKPQLIAWDESATVVMQSGPLGAGVSLATSESVMVPMVGVSTIDIEVPGDGNTVRGAYLDWMAEAEVLHPMAAEHRDLIPEPFSAAAPLRNASQDTERFGTVTASLAEETIRIGASVSQGAAFQFGLEAQPLVALITFEVASPNIASPPEVYLNGESLGPVSVTLPDLADPAYRGETASLVRGMRFLYTGWLRAQKLVPASQLKVGTNDLLIIGGPGTNASAIRATQIQLKYLWDKTDYQIQTDR
ncbi:MAG TPA: hypothetical protein VM940_12935 [Chthoniobacterales bacterium]|jgi:hypothetical protein|nr:hypothetical protein [Chthoniobacterales bacterium]